MPQTSQNPLINQREYVFLEGPKSREFELSFAFSIFWQFIKGFRALHLVGPCVTVFGSARFKEGHIYYEQAREVSRRISTDLGLTIMTGGGPGIMEAANRGAFEAKGRSVGCNIVLPHEQGHNPYMDKWVLIKYFFVRKVLLIKYSYAFVVLPGGVGTMDELFETLTLIQTGTIHNFPVVLMGKSYYAPLITMLEDMVKAGTISPEDLDLLKITDDSTEAVAHISQYITKNYQIRRKSKPLWWLLERI